MPPRKIEKSEKTRASIAEAARRLFAEQGFERTTVRDVATAAGIDPALVMRYFGSKDELFTSVAGPSLGLPDLSSLDPQKIGETLVDHFLDLWERDSSRSALPVLLRSAASNEAAAQLLQQMFAKQVMPAIAGAGDPQSAALRAGLVSSQLLGLALTRDILKLPPVVAMTPDIILREVGKTIQQYIDLK